MLHYLSSPHGAEFQHGAPYDQVVRITAAAIEEGLSMFSPVLYISSFQGRDISNANWQYFRRVMLRQSSRLIVVELPGWESCARMSEDLDIARRFAIPVSRITEEEAAGPPDRLLQSIHQGFVDDFVASIHSDRG